MKLANDYATIKSKYTRDYMDTVFKAAINDETNMKADMMNYFGIINFRTYRNAEESV